MVGLVARTGRELQRYYHGRRQVVGCIPYRMKEEEKQKDDCGKSCSNNCIDEAMEVLVISSQKGGDEIMFPKGGWEIDESIEEAARREALEEAGVSGNIQDSLGKWLFKSKRYGTMYDGFVFPLYVTEELDLWPEMNVRQRRWVTVAEARENCQHWWMKEALEKLVNHLSNTNGKSSCERSNVEIDELVHIKHHYPSKGRSNAERHLLCVLSRLVNKFKRPSEYLYQWVSDMVNRFNNRSL